MDEVFRQFYHKTQYRGSLLPSSAAARRRPPVYRLKMPHGPISYVIDLPLYEP